jgi:type III secretion system FlhB-like substrate exporter
MGRSWISVPIGHGIRIGRSIADYELRQRMPSWRKYELAMGLRDAAAKRGEPMTWRHAEYIVAKARAMGELDALGQPTINAKGDNAGELARQIVAGAAKWGIEVSHEQALAQAAEAVRKADFRRALPRWLAFAAVVIALSLLWMIVR